MKLLNCYYHIIKADLLERTRRFSFLVTICLIIYLGFLVNNQTIIISIGQAQGLLNSAWAGAQMAIIAATMLSLFAFYLVNNCIDRDEKTRVGQIIATTPITKAQYLLGKWISNLIIMLLILCILAVAAIIMQLLYRQSAQMDLWALLSPFLFIALPMLSITAGLAVAFEAIPVLRHGLGNIVYFFLWMSMLIFIVDGPFKEQPLLDPSGINLLIKSITPTVQQVIPTYVGAEFQIGVAEQMSTNATSPLIFMWQGFDWTAEIILSRLAFFILPVLLVLLSSVFFNRFDATKPVHPNKKTKDQTENTPYQATKTTSDSHIDNATINNVYHGNIFKLVFQNIRLMISRQPFYWYLIMGVLWLVALLSPSPVSGFAMAGIAIWAIFIWSKMGCREKLAHTEMILYSAPNPVGRLFFAEWLAGVILAGLLFSAPALRLFVAGDLQGVMACGLTILLIPTIATTCGIFSGTSRLFEILFLLVWYIGPINQISALDFLGITPNALVRSSPIVALIVVIMALTIGLLVRLKQISD